VGTRGTGCTCRCWRCTLTILRSYRLDIVISSATSPFTYFSSSHTGSDIKDSAEWYENEPECGRAILDFCIESGVSRADIFFTTKLKHNAGFDATINAINRSLELCGLDYIDLYLIHGPWGGPDARRQAWEACVAAQKAGKVKSIGISSFGMHHMQELFDSGQPPPAVHQVCSI
jgi:diketogulonate reductase-like aldo/keto reductase